MAEIRMLGGLPGHERKGGGFQTGYEVYDPDGISPTVLAQGGGYGIMVISEIRVIGQMDNTLDHTFESANRVYDRNGLCPTIPTCGGGGVQPKVIEKTIVAMRGRGERNEQRLEPNGDGLANALTTVQKDNLVLEEKMESERQSRIKAKKMPNGNIRFFQNDERKSAISELQLQNPENEAQTITTTGNAKVYEKNPFSELENTRESQKEQEYRIRKLTPRECWRLMAFKDSDFEKAEKAVSSAQLYRQAGNSIVVTVLMAIFLQLNIQGLKSWNERSKEEIKELIYVNRN